MDRETYRRWHDHPLRYIVKRAAAGDLIRDDELDDLRLPPKLKRATRQAIDRAPELKPMQADQMSAELFQALPDGHETREQYEQRRAEAGDADALANIRAREEATERMADRIMRDGAA